MTEIKAATQIVVVVLGVAILFSSDDALDVNHVGVLRPLPHTGKHFT